MPTRGLLPENGAVGIAPVSRMEFSGISKFKRVFTPCLERAVPAGSAAGRQPVRTARMGENAAAGLRTSRAPIQIENAP